MEKVRIASQEIVDLYNNVVAYEILYRSGKRPETTEDNDKATREVLAKTLMEIGYSNMVEDKQLLSFNFTNGNLLHNISESFSPKNMIVEILEDSVMDEQLIEKLKKLKKEGFIVALDDFKTDLVKNDEIYNHVDIIKVDFLNTTKKERNEIKKLTKKFPKITLLAEKIESESQYLEAVESGYKLFQGHFISMPVLKEE